MKRAQFEKIMGKKNTSLSKLRELRNVLVYIPKSTKLSEKKNKDKSCHILTLTA